jgi:hypothetical protein
MFSELKKIRELRRKLVLLEFEEIDAIFKHRRGDAPTNLEDFKRRREEISDHLDIYESRYLIRKAESFGIEVPYKEEWHCFQIKDAEPGKVTGEVITRIKEPLNNLGVAVITKQIRDVRFAYWKGWAEILIPILSLVLAILALLKR